MGLFSSCCGTARGGDKTFLNMYPTTDKTGWSQQLQHEKSLETIAGAEETCSSTTVVADNVAGAENNPASPQKDVEEFHEATVQTSAAADKGEQIESQTERVSESANGGLKNEAVITLQEEYIQALEFEVCQQKANLEKQNEKMEVLVSMMDEEIERKNLKLQNLSLKLLRLEKEHSVKNNTLDIQGQFIQKLEEEIVTLNRQISNSENPGVQNKEVETLGLNFKRGNVSQ